ncbi:ABC transporter ATP-binding protein [Halorarius halobius]|uniref:ABC transporter ATP-binding protein n=1 Tax=Halorarius halobius TaxID=2962671 RepID=UPI0020CD5D52|nr:ABC transporter ATP-binding protein [Halorarius halobius]
MKAIRTDQLTKTFGDVTAVRDLDLVVESGEAFGFLGPNGAGKSTTIDLLLDFTRPTAGDVEVLGHDPRADTRAVRRKVGILPEGYDLYDRLSARRHVAFVADIEGSDDDPDALLERVGLADDADRSVGGFSTGMRQRLALAMALAGDPELLVLDEPSSGLDPNGVQLLRRIINEETRRGTTVFFSSHVLDQVEAVCDRVGILNRGGLVAVDTVEGLREATGASTTLVLDVDSAPDTDELRALGGVERVTATDDTLRVGCSAPEMKAQVISTVEQRGASVTDIDVEETDLEDLFVAYTDGDAPGVDA